MVTKGFRKRAALLVVLLFLMIPLLIVPASSFNPGDVNSWTLKTPMPTARVGFGVAVVGGKIYAIGGEYGSRFLNTTEMYDPATENWTTKASMPTPRSGFGVAVVQNKIYVIGGHNCTNAYLFTGTNEVYDTATDTWETRAPMPTLRGDMDANSVQGKIYVTGGNSVHGITGVNEAYDPAADAWTTKSPMPKPVCVYASATINNSIYVIGGFNGSVDVELNQIYDSLTDSWRYGAPIPFPVSGAGGGATLGVWAPQRIYVVGGITDRKETGNPYPYFLNKCIQNQVYDPEKDAWSGGAALPKSSFDLEVAVVDDILYAIGGTNSAMFYSLYPLIDNNQLYTPIGYGTVPPTVHVVSPENKNYTSRNVTIAFAANKPTVWVGYSLDEQKNITITSNTTIAVSIGGLHNVTVYAKDALGNIGTSETITFNVTEPFSPVFVIAIASAAFVFVVGVTLLIYFKRRSSRNRLMGGGYKMRKIVIILAISIFTFSILPLVGFQTAEAQRTPDGQGFPLASGVNILSPTNSTYSSNVLELNVTIRSMVGPSIYRFEVTYSVDGKNNDTIPSTTTFVPVEATATYPNGTTATVTSIFASYYLISGCVALPDLPEGLHNITVYTKYERINNINTNWPPLILDCSTVCFTINYNIPPVISKLSIENKTYSQSTLSLNFTTDKPTSWMGYSLDGKENVTIAENTTLTGLFSGSHNLTIYANDAVGNIGASETVHFKVKVAEPFPTTSVAASASIGFVCAGLLAFFKKRNRQ